MPWYKNGAKKEGIIQHQNQTSESNLRTSVRTNVRIMKKKFSEALLTIEIKKTGNKMNKPVDLGLPKLELSKIVMLEFWCHYVKPEYGEQTAIMLHEHR